MESYSRICYSQDFTHLDKVIDQSKLGDLDLNLLYNYISMSLREQETLLSYRL